MNAVLLRDRLPHLATALVLSGLILALAGFAELAGSVVLSRLATRMFIDITLVLGLQMFMGNTNILWFPHVGFMGVGAYASVIFSMSPLQKLLSLPELYPFLAEIDLPFLPAVLGGGAVAAAVAALISFPLMRLSAFAAVIANFALLIVIHVVLVHWSALTNGPQTLFGVERHTYVMNSAVWACIFVVLASWFKESKPGLQLRASRDDLISASSLGVNVVAVRCLALVFSAFAAGIGGGLFAHFITSFTPNAFFLTEAFVILAMLVIGGPTTVTGAVMGAVLVTVVYQSLRWAENTLNIQQVFDQPIAGLSDVALAAALIGTLILRPGGIFERTEIGWHALARLKPKAPAAAPVERPAAHRTADAKEGR